ncbi:hypothetical protein PybrP1_002610 [[Pythium] brassicae (nom. inval.)]|nr:hypothetical protein PybrP1_002610 [[Pythium] brassicae (nom. inval.)]
MPASCHEVRTSRAHHREDANRAGSAREDRAQALQHAARAERRRVSPAAGRVGRRSNGVHAGVSEVRAEGLVPLRSSYRQLSTVASCLSPQRERGLPSSTRPDRRSSASTCRLSVMLAICAEGPVSPSSFDSCVPTADKRKRVKSVSRACSSGRGIMSASNLCRRRWTCIWSCSTPQATQRALSSRIRQHPPLQVAPKRTASSPLRRSQDECDQYSQMPIRMSARASSTSRPMSWTVRHLPLGSSFHSESGTSSSLCTWAAESSPRGAKNKGA